jgi:hypothetical protein
MIYTVLSFFAFYALSASGNRRLLQTGIAPEYVPIPAASSSTAAPAVTLPAATNPAVTLPAATLPAATNPGNGNGGGVVLPWGTLPPLPSAATEKLECVMAYTEPGNCAGQIKTITNARNNFKVYCAAEGACAMSNILFEYLPGGFVERIEGIWFTEAYAGYGTTITIRNQQGGNSLLLDRLECNGKTTCEGLTIVLENARVNDIECGYPDHCHNCFIKNGPLDPYPRPCFGW